MVDAAAAPFYNGGSNDGESCDDDIIVSLLISL